MLKKLSYFVLTCLFALCMVTASQAQDPHNVATMGTATVSTTGYGWTPDLAIDGNIDTGSHSADDDPDKWLEVELDQVYTLNQIEVVNRGNCCWERMATVVVKALDADRNEIYVSDPIAEADALQGSVHTFDNGGAGFADVAYIRLEGGTNFLQIMEVRAMITIATAWAPNPADGAIEVDTASLEWTLGDTAVSSKVYLSADATIDDADLLGETDLALQVATLDPGATYYWRVDEIDADGNVAEGEVWSFTTLPLEAHFPSPADGGTNAVSALLSWTAGKDAIMHNVHFGTDPAALLSVSMLQMDTSYDPGALELETTYYWRVDEFALGVTNPGPVWSFSTAPLIPSPEIPDLEAWYTLDQDASSIGVLDMSGNNRHGSIQGDPQWVDGQAGSALEFDGSGDYVNIDGYKGILAVDGVQPAFSITNWMMTTAGGGNNEMVTWGINGEARRLTWRVDGGTLRTEHSTGNIRGNIVVNDGEWHHVALTVVEGAQLRPGQVAFYVDGVEDTYFSGSDNAYNLTEGPDVSLGRRADNNSRFFPGTLDDVRIYSRTLETMEIRLLAGVEELPYSPAPADGEIDLEASGIVLTWNPAQDAVEQDVYLGSDQAAVADANATDTTGIYVGRQAETELALADLGRGVTYFWRVDGVKADGTVMPGTVWNFRILDRNTDNWAAGVDADYLDTYVQDGLYDIGTFGGEQTYEFIVQSNPDETEASMALIGRRQFGDTQVGIKYEQWNNTGTYGATVFGVADHDYGVPTAPGEYTHLVFVSSEAAAATELYVNGALEGSVASAITLSGLVGIGYGAQGEDMMGSFDNFDGTIFGVAIYDRALTADEIAANADKYFSPIPITDPDLLIYYDFESGEGSTAVDQSGHSNHGQFMGNPEWVPGLFGTAVSIDIADLDYIQTAAPLGITSNTVSVTGWVYHDELPAGWSGILTHRGSGNLGLQHDGTELRYMWGPDLYWSFSSGLALPVGEWYFAALTISPDQGKLYLNGVEQTATNVAPHDPVDFDSLIRVGRDHNDGRIMTSLIDEVRLYNRTLTGFEIAMLTEQPYVEDFEAYAAGDQLHGVGGWAGWGGDAGAGAPVSDTFASSGANSVEVVGSADLVQEFNVAGGTWIVSAMQYIPSGTTGTTYFILLNQFGAANDWSIQTTFNMDSGVVGFWHGGEATIVYDQWVELKYVIDLDNNTVDKYYNGEFVVTDTWDDNAHGTLGAIDLFGNGASSVYYDDITIEVPLTVVGHWTFDDGAGDVALDSSGYNNDGTVMLATWVEGLDGGALDMAGVGYVDVPAESWSSIENEMTVAFWAYGDPAVMPQSHTVFAAFSDPENNEARIASAHIPWGNGNVYFDTGGTPTSGGYDRISTAAAPDEYAGQWRHWAFVKNAVTGDQQIYLDGKLWHSGTGFTRPLAGVTAFTIGARNDGTEIYPGIVDDFRLYSQALSAIQIHKLANP